MSQTPGGQPRDKTGYDETEFLISATECTGLIPALAQEEDTQALREMYNVHKRPE